MEPKAAKLPAAPSGAQNADRVTGKAGDPNIAGYADTTDTIDPMAGPLEFDNDNEDYKRFWMKNAVPESALGGADSVIDHDPPTLPASVIKRDGGSHAGWGGHSSRTGSDSAFGDID
jgi:hypothetical protein